MIDLKVDFDIVQKTLNQNLQFSRLLLLNQHNSSNLPDLAMEMFWHELIPILRHWKILFSLQSIFYTRILVSTWSRSVAGSRIVLATQAFDDCL